jgi:hypothetical protein
VFGVGGLRIKPDTWNVVVGSLFTFFGAYGIVSSLLAMIPIMWGRGRCRRLVAGIVRREFALSAEPRALKWPVIDRGARAS